MKDYLLSRLAERSTWAGLIAVLGAFGVWNATPEQASAITALALAVMGGFSAAVPDRVHKPLQPPAHDRLAAMYDELDKPVQSDSGSDTPVQAPRKVDSDRVFTESYWGGKKADSTPLYPDER